MKKIEWKVIKNSEISERDLVHIAYIKDQHWTHGVKSQVDWMKNNLLPDDIHLLGKIKGDLEPCAYLSLVNIKVTCDNDETNFIGLGNVCVSKNDEHFGIGSSLVLQANNYIMSSAKRGLLLCKDPLISFYKKNGWEKLNYTKALISNCQYYNNIMTFPTWRGKTINEIIIDKNF